jgi:hypothetical protein
VTTKPNRHPKKLSSSLNLNQNFNFHDNLLR